MGVSTRTLTRSTQCASSRPGCARAGNLYVSTVGGSSVGSRVGTRVGLLLDLKLDLGLNLGLDL